MKINTTTINFVKFLAIAFMMMLSVTVSAQTGLPEPPLDTDAVPTASITTSGASTFCAGGTVTLSANTGIRLTYLWSPGGATTSSIDVTTSGTYTVKVSNSSGETISDPITVTVNPNTTETTTVIAIASFTWSAGDGLTYAESGTYTFVDGCNTKTLALTIATTLLPTADTVYTLCAGTKLSGLVATAVPGATGVNIYTDPILGGPVVLSGATDVVLATSATPKAYYLTEPTLGGESARVRVYVVVNALPTTPSALVLTNDAASVSTAPVTALGSFVGTNTPFKLTATATSAAAYKWTLPTGVVRTDITGATTDYSTANTTANFIYVKFTGTGVATPLVINVQSVNASGCTSLVKASAPLTRLLPLAPGALAMNNGANTTAITSFAKYMGTNTVLRLSAAAAVTANSYLWELPTGVNRMTALTGGVITNDLTSTAPFIFVNFAGVTLGNTHTNAAVITTLTKVLRLGVKSVNGVGVSTTSNATAVNPTTMSTAKLLTLSAVAPAAPTAIALNNGTLATAITVISKFIGQGGVYRLSAAVPATTIANSFVWELPACVTRVTSTTNITPVAGLNSTNPEIFVRFNGTNPAAGFVYFGVKAVNGIGSSVTSNSTAVPTTSSTAKLLKLAVVLPAAPTALVLNNGSAATAITVISKFIGQGGTYRLSAAVPATTLANSFAWELPACATRVTDIGGLTADNTSTSTDPFIFVKFNGTNPAAGFVYFGVKAVNSVGSSVTNNSTASPITSSTAKLLKLATVVPAAPTALVLNNGSTTTAITVISKLIGQGGTYRLSAAVPSTTLANSFEWELPACVTRVTDLGGSTAEVSTASTDPFIFVKFNGINPVAGFVYFGVKSVNSVGLSVTNNSTASPATSSTAKLLKLAVVLPAAPTALVLNNGSAATAITVISKFIGQGGTYRLSAAVPTTTLANSFEWELPACVTRVTDLGGSTPEVSTASTNPEIFVKFNGTNPAAGSIYFGVKSVNSVGLSVTSNSAASPATSSTAKLLKLATVVPAAPTALVLNDVNNGPSTTAVTALGKYIGTTTKLKLTTTVPTTTLANSFAWTLPSGVNRVDVNGDPVLGLTSTDPFIYVNFAGITPLSSATISIVLGVNAVNSVGASTAKTLNVSAGLPVVVGAVTGSTTVCNRVTGINYTITTAPAGANYYQITGPTGSVVTSASVPANATNVLTTSDLTFNVVYASFVSPNNKLAIKSGNAFGLFGTAKLLTLTFSTICPTTRSISDAPVAEDFSVIAYPNPSSDVFTLDVQSSTKGATGVQVYDMTGRLIENRQVNSNSVEVGRNYASGVYNVIVNKGAQVKTLRVIKR